MNALSHPAAPLPPTGGWLRQTWRLTGWNLRLIRRRWMTVILLGILLIGYALVLGLGYLAASAGGDAGAGIGRILAFPNSLALAGGYMTTLGVLLAAILAGTFIGAEYTHKTHILPLLRGESHAQIVTAQAGALAIVALLTVALMLGLSAITGVLLGPVLGHAVTSIDGAGAVEVIEYWLALSLNVFGFMLVAVFMATLGRSAASGVALSIGYIVVENLLNEILPFIAAGSIGTVISRLPNAFIGNNLGAVVQHVSKDPLVLTSAEPSIGLTQSLVVTGVYVVVLIGGSYLLSRLHDATD
jgi:hypothetical protein